MFFSTLAVYFCIHIALRVGLGAGGGLELDEAEQVVFSQTLSWGYNSQPPLYNWLQTLTFSVLGTHLFSLALLKNLFLGLTYFSLYRSARIVGLNIERAILSCAPLILISAYSWESQRDLSHTVAACLFSGLLWTVSALILRSIMLGATFWYWIVPVISLGVLSKSNFLLAAIPWLIAGLSLAPVRQAMNIRVLLATVCGILILLTPFALWIWATPESAFQSMNQFIPETPAATRWQGLFDYLGATVGYAAPLIILGLLFTPCRSEAPLEGSDLNATALLLRSWLNRYLVGVVVLLAFMLLAGVTDIRSRWLLPAFMPLPLWWVLHFRGISWASPRCYGSAMLLCTIAGIGILVAITDRWLGAQTVNEAEHTHWPAESFARQMDDLGYGDAVMVTNSRVVAGSLRLYLPECTVIDVDLPEAFASQLMSKHQAELIAVWSCDDQNMHDADSPLELFVWLSMHGLRIPATPDAILTLEAPAHRLSAWRPCIHVAPLSRHG